MQIVRQTVFDLFLFDVFISINFGFDRMIFLNQKNIPLYDVGGWWSMAIHNN